ncbi:MAG: electron transfer flavoprotein subunit alpha/FixB family protein, partial [Aureibaculum sp.]|nr:electron transfer flavoprotein subunit alpha/FixB family protein [Aureibaculum sp.]
MCVLVFAESSEGKFKKIALEVTSYGKKIAEALNTSLEILTINANDTSILANYGADKIIKVTDEKLLSFNAKAYANVIKQVAEKNSATVIVIDSSANGIYLAPLVASHLEAGYASKVIAVPSSTVPFIVKRQAFSNKAFCNTEITTAKKVIGLAKNSFGLFEHNSNATEESFTASLTDNDFGISSTEVETSAGKVTIADADIVVSAGRGLKGPENWGMIEELAELLDAQTACSRPVADMDWRPHHEHVGQTGIAIRPDLYIAAGISGAIQHLAGVNGSKVIVVINTDPEAPFFKAADYGIVG